MAGRVGLVCRQLLSLRGCGSVLPGAGVRSSIACFSTGDETKPAYTPEYFKGLVKNKPLVVFMKGDPSAPMCGFSRLVVQILHMHGVERYDHHNILDDVDFKEGMKKFSNWPTFPQVYMNSELVGGADIVLQMHQSGEMVSELEKIGHKSSLQETQQSKGNT